MTLMLLFNINNIIYIDKMPIKVLVSSIDNNELNKILDFYNSNKDANEEPLELLDRAEGGFQIRIPNMKNLDCDPNKNIKQLRWSKGYLVRHDFYRKFTEKEEILLYKALHFGLDGNVLLE